MKPLFWLSEQLKAVENNYLTDKNDFFNHLSLKSITETYRYPRSDINETEFKEYVEGDLHQPTSQLLYDMGK